jgi:hypothetical protein
MAQHRAHLEKLDPTFARQLDAAEDDVPVEAVVRLQPTDPAAMTTQPEETDRLTRELVERVQQKSGQREHGLNIFPNLGSFAISASPQFFKTLIAQPEVAAVVANRQPEAGSIPVVSKRPASLDEVGRRRAPRPRPTARAKTRRPRKP